MLPDPNKITKQKARMCKGTNPAYNEKFNLKSDKVINITESSY